MYTDGFTDKKQSQIVVCLLIAIFLMTEPYLIRIFIYSVSLIGKYFYRLTMDLNEYRVRGKEMVDFIYNYLETISERKVCSSVRPGYLAPLLPKEAPKKPEKWEDIMKDVETKIIPGLTHWYHPNFYAYFPNGCAFASFLGDMLSDGLGSIGFSWASSPACTELETIVLDWLGKALNIPEHLLYYTPGSIGGGVIQGSASECVLVSMLTGRAEAISYLKEQNNDITGDDSIYLPKLVAYTSEEAHSCLEKAAKISLVKLRILEADELGSLRGPTVADAIEKDVNEGLHPFFIGVTLGTTGICGFDNLKEIGPIVCKLTRCWLHVDAAYAGGSFICPELRYLKEGLEFADSFNMNCNKLLNVCFDCSCLWIRDRHKLINALNVDPVYLRHENASVTINYRHWMIPLSRRFRSLKLWFTLRNYGIEKLQNYVRNHIKLAKYFENLVREDDLYEVCNNVKLGLVCFRHKKGNEVTQGLLDSINKEGVIHMVPTAHKNKFLIRFCAVNENLKESDIDFAWNLIQYHGTQVMMGSGNKSNEGVEAPTVATALIQNDHFVSFTQTVPLSVYRQLQKSSFLKSEDSPIYLPDIPLENLSLLSDSFEETE